MVKTKDAVAFWGGMLASVTWNVRIDPGTGDVGVPLIKPVAGFSVSPEGSLPAVSCHV
jgi:hypothetical protein